MKKLFLIVASMFTLFAAERAYSFGGNGAYGNSGSYGYGQDAACGCEQPAGECYCKYVKYQPCPYTTTRCVQECIPCTKKCCRMVPSYYQVQKCRYVPEYYNVTCCRSVCEYYDAPDCRYVTRTICEPHCNYKPVYFWKKECRSACAPQAPCGH